MSFYIFQFKLRTFQEKRIFFYFFVIKLNHKPIVLATHFLNQYKLFSYFYFYERNCDFS